MLGSASSINNYSNVFGVQQGLSVEQLAKTVSAAKREKTGDSVTISSSANALQQLLDTEMQGGNSADIGELDLTGLTQLKQRGEMLANMLQLKMKNFETNLMTSMKGAGMPMQEMNLKNGDDGLLLTGDLPANSEAIQGILNKSGSMQGEFSDIAKFAEVLNMLQQMGTDGTAKGLMGFAGVPSAAQYAQQSLPTKMPVKQPESDFVMHVTETGTSFSFE